MADTTISLMSNSTSYDGLLKDVYLPTLTETVYNDSKFTALIQKTSSNIDYEGQRVVHAFGTQRSAGVGAIAEGGDFVGSVPIKGKQGHENVKYLNAYIELTGPVIRAARSERGSYSPAVSRHFKTNILAQKNYFERMLMGNSNGSLGVVSETNATADENFTGAANSISIDGAAYFDTQFFEPGQTIVAHTGTTWGTEHTYDGTLKPMTVSAVSKGDKGTTNGYITIAEDLDASSTIAALDHITLESAYGSGSGTTLLEINGLGGLVGASTSDNSASTAWGLTRSSYDYLQSYHKAVNAELDEEVLLDAIITLENQYQGSPNLLMVDPRAMKKYFMNVKDDRRFNTMTAMEWTGGYNGLGIQLGTTNLMLTSLSSMTEGQAFLIDTNDFAFATMSNGWEWILGDGGNVLVQDHSGDSKFASAINYLQFVCYDPGRQCKLTGITT